MPGDQPLGSHLSRRRMVAQALWLVSISVAFGALSGIVSVITGLQGHSLSVFAVGLGVLADVTGSAVLIWRFRAERHQPMQSGAQETRGAIIVSVASLALYHALGWWWADRVAALAVAVVAAAEAWHTAPRHSSPG